MGEWVGVWNVESEWVGGKAQMLSERDVGFMAG